MILQIWACTSVLLSWDFLKPVFQGCCKAPSTRPGSRSVVTSQASTRELRLISPGSRVGHPQTYLTYMGQPANTPSPAASNTRRARSTAAIQRHRGLSGGRTITLRESSLMELVPPRYIVVRAFALHKTNQGSVSGSEIGAQADSAVASREQIEAASFSV